MRPQIFHMQLNMWLMQSIQLQLVYLTQQPWIITTLNIQQLQQQRQQQFQQQRLNIQKQLNIQQRQQQRR